MPRPAVVVCLALLAANAVAAPAAATEHGGVVLTYTIAKDDDLDHLTVTLNVTLPDRLTEFRFELPDAALAVVAVSGFEPDGGTYDYRWEDAFAEPEPSLVYTIESDRTFGELEGLDAAETAEWAFTRHEHFDGRWRYRATGTTDPGWTVEIVPDGPGVAGHSYVYLGDATETTRSVGGHDLHLVVPRAARVDEAAVFDSIDLASRTLVVGDRDATVYLWVTQDPIRVGGQAAGEWLADRQAFWVHEDAALDDDGVGNTWIHEYVHLRQYWANDPSMEWVDEGMADYYEHLVELHRGDGSFDAFYAEVSTDEHATERLTAPATWPSVRVQYTKGERVVAALDNEVRAATDGERTFRDVFRRLNDHDGSVTPFVFTSILEGVAGRSFDAWFDRYVDGTEAPPVANDPGRFGPPDTEDVDGDGLSIEAEADLGTDPFDADTDGDELADGVEVETHGTDPTDADTDDDGVVDGFEVNEFGTDPLAADTDGDGVEDGREIDHGADPLVTDTDGDGLDDAREIDALGTDPANPDTDRDGLDDRAEVETHGTSPTAFDSDGDGLEDAREVVDLGTDPTATDSDGDGLADGREVREAGTDPTVADSDGDGLADGAEVTAHRTDPLVVDTDGDGLDDGREVELGTNPTVADTDGDGLEDGTEIADHGTDPTSPDTDGDLVSDADELRVLGSDPTLADTDGDGIDDFREERRGTDPTASDTDGDGYPDADEVALGTDPRTETGFVAYWIAKLWSFL